MTYTKLMLRIKTIEQEAIKEHKEKVIADLLRKADIAHSERDYSAEDRFRDAASAIFNYI